MNSISDAARSWRCLSLAIVVAGLLSGCGGSLIAPAQTPPQIYVLKPQFHEFDDLPRVNWQLAVGRPDAAETLRTARIALERSDTMDFYADAQWTDTAPRLVQLLLVEAFETSGRIAGVAPEAGGVRADYLLEMELRDFEAQYQGGSGPPDIHVRIVARLLTTAGEVVGTYQATREAPATQNSVPAVVEAFDRATGDAFEDIVAWTLKTPGPAGVPGRSATRS